MSNIFAMDPAHLEPDEVMYELRIRNVNGIDGNHRRCSSALRTLLRNEATNERQIELPAPADMDLNEELSQCDRKI